MAGAGSSGRCRVGVIHGQEMLLYSFPNPHPFRKERVIPFMRGLDELEREFGDSIVFIKPETASVDRVLLFHDKRYVDFVRECSEIGEGYLDYGDTPAFKGCYEASLYVVGSTLKLVNLVLSGGIDHGFNPVGGLHHARRDGAAGFCIFNDAAIAIKYLLDEIKLREVLYVDIDAHHGDGVFYSFYFDKRVRILDFHQSGRTLYPGTGFEHERGGGEAIGTKLNVNLLPGAGFEEFKQSWEDFARDFLNHSDPDFILLQAGADGLEGDPLTGLNYNEEVHEFVAGQLHKLAHEKCHGRLVAMGGGGYDPVNVSKAWTAVIRALATPP
ncbi:MAG: acetoin utilization protein AcuC [Aigarchaeota archaeon]|nr:acetoin utilization protein AcuC [Aigarchaeota archaeon]